MQSFLKILALVMEMRQREKSKMADGAIFVDVPNDLCKDSAQGILCSGEEDF